MKLVLLDETMRDAYLAMVDEFEAAGEGYPYNNIPLAREDWSAYVAELRDEEAGIGLPPGIVPQWTYVLVLDDGTIAGEIRFRPGTEPPFADGHDHIGYNVRPSQRKRGYATFMLGNVLDMARTRGLAHVILSVGATNKASMRTIARFGGEVINHYTNGDGTDGRLIAIRVGDRI